MKLLTLFAIICLLGLTLAVDLQQCQSSLSSFQVRLEALSHYVPPAPKPKPNGNGMGMGMDGMDGMDGGMDDMDGGMDDMDGGMDSMDMKKRESSDPTAPELNCFFYNATTSMMYINCDSHKCLSVLNDMIAEYDTLFIEECPMVSGFVPDENSRMLVDAMRSFPGCNRCAVAFTRFSKLKDEIVAQNCWATESFYSCNENCLALNSELSNMQNHMLSAKVCRMNNPGGCGEDGGLTEGQMYDALVALNTEMTRISTVSTLCRAECNSALTSWFQKWQPEVASECIESDNFDFENGNMALSPITLKPQCNEECPSKIETLIASAYSVPLSCMNGFPADHLSSLVNSINPSFCKEDDEEGFSYSNVLEDPMVRAVLIGIAGVCFAALMVLLIVVSVNACKGRKGKELFLIGGGSNPYRKVGSVERDDSEEMTIKL